jgi:hypothetical protein
VSDLNRKLDLAEKKISRLSVRPGTFYETFPRGELYSPGHYNVALKSEYDLCAVGYIQTASGSGGQCGMEEGDEKWWKVVASGGVYCTVVCMKMLPRDLSDVK